MDGGRHGLDDPHTLRGTHIHGVLLHPVRSRVT
jgi:hypothetical protein